MHILINIDVIEKYFGNFTPKTKSEFDRNIDELFSNKNNKLLFSEKFVALAEDYLASINQNYRAYFSGYIQDLFNNDRYKGVESGKGKSLEDEFINILELENENIFVAFALSKSLKLSSHKKKDRIIFLTSYTKLSNEWILLNLAAKHYLKVRYFDFSTKVQIEKFYESIFAIPKKITNVYIFDRYCNTNHNLYKPIAKKKVNVKCFKHRAIASDVQQINEYYGKPYQIYNTHNLDLVHERNVLFENIIIESNEDPVNIDVDRETWALHVQYSKDDYSKLISKETKFNLFSEKAL